MFGCKIAEKQQQKTTVEYFDNCPLWAVVAVLPFLVLSPSNLRCVSIKVIFVSFTYSPHTQTRIHELLAQSSRMRGNALQFAVSNCMIRSRDFASYAQCYPNCKPNEAALSHSRSHSLCRTMISCWWYKTVKQFGALLDTCRRLCCCCYVCLCCCAAR